MYYSTQNLTKPFSAFSDPDLSEKLGEADIAHIEPNENDFGLTALDIIHHDSEVLGSVAIFESEAGHALYPEGHPEPEADVMTGHLMRDLKLALNTQQIEKQTLTLEDDTVQSTISIYDASPQAVAEALNEILVTSEDTPSAPVFTETELDTLDKKVTAIESGVQDIDGPNAPENA